GAPRHAVDVDRGQVPRARVRARRRAAGRLRARQGDARGLLPVASASDRCAGGRGSRAMSMRRLLEVARVTLLQCVRRPLFWVLLVVLGLLAWGMSFGSVRVS